MARDEANLPTNVRRLAGMHLASLETLAEYLGISRQAMQAIVAYYVESRSRPRTATTFKLAEAFGVSLDALYDEPVACLREAVENFELAPLRLFMNERTRETVERIKAKPVQKEIPKDSLTKGGESRN